MYYQSNSLWLYIYGQSGCRRNTSIIKGLPGDDGWENSEMQLEAIMARISISHHHHCQSCQDKASRGYIEIMNDRRWLSSWRGGGGVWRFWDNGDELSNGEYIDIISLYEIHAFALAVLVPLPSWRAFIDSCNVCGCSATLAEPS